MLNTFHQSLYKGFKKNTSPHFLKPFHARVESKQSFIQSSRRVKACACVHTCKKLIQSLFYLHHASSNCGCLKNGLLMCYMQSNNTENMPFTWDVLCNVLSRSNFVHQSLALQEVPALKIESTVQLSLYGFHLRNRRPLAFFGLV
jgi:hypothetical protein